MSTRRFGLLAGAIWLPAFAVVVLVLAVVEEALRSETAQWMQEELEHTINEVRYWHAFGDDEPLLLELPKQDWESFVQFRATYRALIEDRLTAIEPSAPTSDERSLLAARLVLLGAGDQVTPTAAVSSDRVARLMLTETPELLHERLERLMELHWDDLATMEDADLGLVDAEAVAEWFLEEHDIDHVDRCVALIGSDNAPVISNLVAVPDAENEIVEVHRIVEHEEGDETILCVARQTPLADGSRLVLGAEASQAYLVYQETAGWGVLIMLALGLGTLIVGVIVGRSERRRLALVDDVCRRVREGDLGRRIPDLGRDALGQVARHINDMLEQTEQLTESLRSMSANIAHDLRTPLTRLRGQIDLLTQSREPDREMVAAVQAEADQLLDTFSALLRIAQVESGSPRRAFRDFDFVQLLRDVCELYEPAFDEKQIQFEPSLPERSVVVNGDLDLWMQSLANVFDNALKYVPAGCRVSLAFQQRNAGYLVTIADSGPGIPDLELDRVLDRFYRLPKHRGKRGNGLGLSLVAAVCQLHGARLSLRNRSGLVIDIELAPEPRDRGADS